MLVKIIRMEENQEGTFGILAIDRKMFCLTLELPWRQNKKNESSIYPGCYDCVRKKSWKHGETFEVKNVYNRKHILFHIGNTIDDTKGCILLGDKIGEWKGKRAVLSSAKAFTRFMSRMDLVDRFDLIIENYYQYASF